MGSMRLLSDLPPVVLAEVTSWLLSTNIGLLYLCGSHLLNWKLTEGAGVKYWRHKLSFERRPIWPNMLTLFPHVTHLWIVDVASLALYPLNDAKYELLPRKLEFLYLSFRGCATSLETALCQHENLFPYLKSLHIDASSTDYNLITKRLPTLIDLSVTTQYPAGRTANPLKMSVLPPKLTRLVGTLTRDQGEAVQYPSTLTEADLVFAPGATPQEVQDFGLLPTCMTTLSISGCPLAREADWNKFPRALEDLSIPVDSISVANAASLPPHLHRLCIYIPFSLSINAEAIANLPQSLQILDFGRLQFDVSMVAALPRGLTDLGINHNIPVSAVPFLPTGLRCVSIEHHPQALFPPTSGPWFGCSDPSPAGSSSSSTDGPESADVTEGFARLKKRLSPSFKAERHSSDS